MLLPDRNTIDLIKSSHARRRAALERSNAIGSGKFTGTDSPQPLRGLGWSADAINEVRQAEIAARTRTMQIGGVR